MLLCVPVGVAGGVSSHPSSPDSKPHRAGSHRRDVSSHLIAVVLHEAWHVPDVHDAVALAGASQALSAPHVVHIPDVTHVWTPLLGPHCFAPMVQPPLGHIQL